jgi:hypothetical protein
LRPRSLLISLYDAFAVTLLSTTGVAAAATGQKPSHQTPPTISGGTKVGDGLTAHTGTWTGATSLTVNWDRCNTQGSSCKVIDLASGQPDTATTYKLTATDVGHTIRVTVEGSNAYGDTYANSAPTATIATDGAPTAPSSTYFSTVPSSQNNGIPPAGIPRSDATCAAEVTPAAENRSQNTTANNTVPSNPSSITWSPSMYSWTNFVADRDKVTGNYKGTTDEILQWTACKWGIDEDIVRADAVLESDWIQSTVGDNCGTAGEASYGILQAKNKDCSGDWVNGGYPYTQSDTALDADYWGARLRACYDGAFYEAGSSWLYNGQTIAQVIAAHGDSYALWGCIGAWYSGNWYDSGAQQYISKVQSDYNSKPWTQPGF